MKPFLPVVCNYYVIRNPKFYLPPIKHAFAEQMIQYGLINLLNNDKDASDILIKICWNHSIFLFIIRYLHKVKRIVYYIKTALIKY